jgi:TRAP transporter TAXI family solute receptor
MNLKKHKLKLFFHQLAMVLTLAMGATGAAYAVDSYPTLLCPQGCGPIAADTILMNQMIKAGSSVVLQPQETPGYVANIREMANKERWGNTVFATEDPIIQLAFRGGDPEVKEFLPDPIQIRFKLLYGEAWWAQGKFFATYNPDLKTVQDLKGKKIALGLRSQSDWGFFSRLFLEHGYGITPENSTINHMTPGSLTQKLIDRNVDAAVTVFGTEPDMKAWLIGGPMRQLEAAGDIRYIGIPKKIVDKVNKKLGTTFLSVTVPSGTLPNQKEDLQVAINRGYKAVHPTFSEDAAYQIVKSVLEIGPKMKELHPLWTIWTPGLMVHGLSEENTHPGAIRAYKEAGVWNMAVQDFADFKVTYPTI